MTAATAAPAQDATTVSPAPYRRQPLGYFQASATNAAQGLTALSASASVPLAGIANMIGPFGPARLAVIYVETAGIRWLDDGQAPTASYGFPIAAGLSFEFSGDLNALAIIQQAAGAVVNVALYR